MRYIEQWCEIAVSYIRFPPDREKVKQELLEHMSDKYEDYVAQGMLLNEAERRTVKEMGEARDTGLLLRKIHKPYLGWVWRFTQWVLGIALVFALFTGIRWADDLHFTSMEEVESPYNGWTNFGSTEQVTKHSVSRRVWYAEPGCADKSDGLTFTVTKAAYWEGTYTDPAIGYTADTKEMYFLLEIRDPRPWVEYTDAPRWFYAVDSLGNYYYSSNEYSSTEEPSIHGNGYRTGLNTWTFYMWANNYCSQQADWLELRYDRDGRDIKLRIDLTGGEDT